MENTPEEKVEALEPTSAANAAEETSPKTEVKPVETQTETPKEEQKKEEPKKEEEAKPEVIVKKERGFAHYVGFALLTLLAITFFFMPGISIAFLINKVGGGLQAATAWIISASFSFLIWLMFKLKIKGFKKASAWYIGFCGLVFLILMLLSQLGNYQIFLDDAGKTGIFNILLP
jgi:hypothetical protein